MCKHLSWLNVAGSPWGREDKNLEKLITLELALQIAVVTGTIRVPKKWTSQNDTALAKNYYLNVTLGVNIGDTNFIDFSFSLLKPTWTFDTDCGIFEVLGVSWVGTALLHSMWTVVWEGYTEQDPGHGD